MISILLMVSSCHLLPKTSPKEQQSPDNIIEEQPETILSPEIGDGSENEHRELTMENIVQIYGDTIFRFNRQTEKTVALTFDDGPDQEFTPQILKILKEYNVPATFFIVGIRGIENPDILRQINKEGHEIGHHGYHHYKMSNLTPKEISDELDQVNQLLNYQIGKSSRIFRPPYGAIDTELVETVKEEGFYIILWDIDSLDWRSLNKDQVLENIMPYIHPGAIVLQHSAGGPGEDLSGTVKALPYIITTLQEQGYRFVTISEMLEGKFVFAKKKKSQDL